MSSICRKNCRNQNKNVWACSSVGRAPRSQRGGHQFDPGQVHHKYPLVSSSKVTYPKLDKMTYPTNMKQVLTRGLLFYISNPHLLVANDPPPRLNLSFQTGPWWSFASKS